LKIRIPASFVVSALTLAVAGSASAANAPTQNEPVVAAAKRAAEPPAVGWFGLGVRVGVNGLSLSAPRAASVIGGKAEAAAKAYPGAAASMSLDANLFQVVPTLHLGGSGYFFKLEAPIGRSSSLNTIGLGLYPVNIGVHIKRLRLLPTFSAGGVISNATSRRTDSSGAVHKAEGGLFETKVGLGVKFFPKRGLAMSLDIARTPWAFGIVFDDGAAKRAQQMAIEGNDPGRAGDILRGGIGSGWEITLGIHWL